MYINKIKFKNYRNLQDITLNPCRGVNVIYGNNAQGKTNIIEGIWLFSGEKSFRNSKDRELIKFGFDEASISIDFFSKGREQSASINLFNKKDITLNGVHLNSPTELSESCFLVVFSPDHLALLKEGPEQRRRFLDIAISSMYPIYYSYLRNYYRCLKQRNTILKNAKNDSTMLIFLDEYDKFLAEYGVRIIKARKRYVYRIEDILKKSYLKLSDNSENLSVEYSTPVIKDSSEELYNELKSRINKDIEMGYTGCGPHRDDLLFQIDGINAKDFGSQGQQRSIVLALKMAEAELIYDVIGEHPVILLDDVMSELDEKRQEYILNNIDDKQIFITCCEESYAKKLKAGKTFNIKNGEIL